MVLLQKFYLQEIILGGVKSVYNETATTIYSPKSFLTSNIFSYTVPYLCA